MICKRDPFHVESGLHEGIAFEDYRRIDAVNASYLKRLAHCPANALVEPEDTPALKLGRGLHKYALEGSEAFDREYVVEPELQGNKKRNIKVNLDIIKGFASDYVNTGIEVISHKDFQNILGTREGILKHPYAKRLLEDGIVEQTVVWDNPEFNVKCKARVDKALDKDLRMLVDLKSSESAEARKFRYKIYQFGYHIQSKHYLDGYNIASGLTDVEDNQYDSFLFIVAEPKEPYRTEVYFLSDRFLELGGEEVSRLLELNEKCLKENNFPNFNDAGISEIRAFGEPEPYTDGEVIV